MATQLSKDDPRPLTEAFREVMAAVAAPVAVITSISDGSPHGTTVSAFASLSLRPPMMLVCLDRRSELLGVIRRSGRYGVNVLGSPQSHTALRFASKGGAGKFTGTPWQLDHDLPRLPDTVGWLACEVTDIVDGGDHLVLLGNVEHAERSTGRPLTYHDREFGTHTTLE